MRHKKSARNKKIHTYMPQYKHKMYTFSQKQKHTYIHTTIIIRRTQIQTKQKHPYSFATLIIIKLTQILPETKHTPIHRYKHNKTYTNSSRKKNTHPYIHRNNNKTYTNSAKYRNIHKYTNIHIYKANIK